MAVTQPQFYQNVTSCLYSTSVSDSLTVCMQRLLFYKMVDFVRFSELFAPVFGILYITHQQRAYFPIMAGYYILRQQRQLEISLHLENKVP